MFNAFLHSRNARRVALFPLATLLVGLGIAATTAWAPHQHLSWRMSDLLLQAFGYATPDERIVIVGIDDDSLSDDKGFGKRLTEWDRTIYAELIRYLQKAGARVIVFDILFAGTNEQGDQNFAAALQGFSPVILNVIETNNQFRHPTPLLAQSNIHLGLANVLVDSDHVVRRIPLRVTNDEETHETLALQAVRLFWRLPPQIPLGVEAQRATLPNGLEIALDVNENMMVHFARLNQYVLPNCGISNILGRATEGTPVQGHPIDLAEPAPQQWQQTQASWPPNRRFFTNWETSETAAVEDAPLARQSTIDKAAGQALRADAKTCPDVLFRDKIVFVGATAIATGDVHTTPMGQMFGVEIHANATASLLHQAALQEQSPATRRFVIASLALLLGLMGMLRKPVTLILTTIYGALCALGLAIVAYHIGNMRLDLAGPLLTFGLVGPTVLVLQNVVQRRERGEIIALLSMQISPSVSRELLHAYDRNELVLGGELRQVSVVFIDMRNYTTLAETLAPERVMHIINTYLGIIAEELIKYDGTLSQYVGDQAMAIFNAPVDQPDHAQRAVSATVAALEAVGAYNQQIRTAYEADGRAGEPPLLATFGAGINTGDAVAGNIGTSERYNYTVIGDIVNVAARLCNAAPSGAIYIGPVTQNALSVYPELSARIGQVGPISLKGKAESMPVYSIQLTDNEPIAPESETR